MTRAATITPDISIGGSSASSVDAVFWIQVLIVLGAFCTFFSFFFHTQIIISLDPDWSHAYLVPGISAYYIYERRRRILAESQPGRTVLGKPWNPLGLLAMAGGFLGYLFFTYDSTRNHFGQGMAMVLTLLGVVLFLVGWRMWVTLIFPMLYLILGVRMPEHLLQLVTPSLQVYASKGSYYLLSMLGYNVDIAGTVLTVYDKGMPFQVNVAEACSGMRMIVAFIALGVAVAFLSCDRWWQRVAVIIMGVPIAILVNVFRVASLGVLSTWNGDLAQGESHILIGMLWLVPALVMYMGFVWVLHHSVVADEVVDRQTKAASGKPGKAAAAASRPTQRGHLSWPATIVTTVLLTGGYGAFLTIQRVMKVELRKLPVAIRHPLRELPSQAGRWKAIGPDKVIPKEELDALGTDQYVSRDFALDGDPRHGILRLDVTYYTGGIDSVPHIPDRCYVGGGLVKAPTSTNEPVNLDQSLWWPDPDFPALPSNPNPDAKGEADQPYMMAQASDASRAVVRMPRLPDDGLEMNCSEYWPPGHADHKIAAGYFFIANGSATPSTERVRLYAYNLREKYAYYCKVQLTLTNATGSVDRHDLSKAASPFLKVMLPDIMRCLPDWHDVTAGTWPPDHQAGGDRKSEAPGN